MQQAIAPVSTARRSRQNLLARRPKESSNRAGSFEPLEGRRLMSAGGHATADFTNNQDVIIAGDAITFLGTTAGETYHLSATAGQLTVTSTTQGTYTRSLNGLNAIYWYGNGGNDTLFVDALNGPTLNINGGSGNDVFHVGNGDLDGNATNTITVTDSADFDTLVLSDILDAGADTFTFDTGSTFTKPGVQVKYGDTDRVEFLATGNADTIYVKSLNTETQYSLGGWGGNDQFIIQPAAFEAATGSRVSIFGGTGEEDSLFVDDSNDDANSGYRIDADKVTRYGVMFREVNYDGVENVRLDASDAAKHNTFSLVAGASGTTYTVHAGAGDDTFDFGNSDVDTNMPNTNWTLLGESGSDALRYYDEADTGSTDTYTVKSQAINKTYGANAVNVYFNSLSSLQLSANTGGTDITVEELSQATTIFAGGGADDITIQDTYQAVGTGVYIPLALDAGTGLDTVRLTDIAHVQFEQSQDLANLVVGAGGLVKVKPSIGETTVIDTKLFSGNGRVDLANGAMAIRDWPINDVNFIRSRLITGYDNGSWYTPGGPAIYSTTSDDGIGALGYGMAGTVGLTQIGGTSLNAQDLVIRKTIYGDANIDGKVDFNDLLSLAKAYGQTNQHWSNGDFDYNGSVDFNDLLSIAKNYGQPVPTLAAPFSSTPIGSSATRRRAAIDL